MRHTFTALLLSVAAASAFGCASTHKASSTNRRVEVESAPASAVASSEPVDDGARARAAERFAEKKPIQGTVLHFEFNDSGLSSTDQAKLTELASALGQDDSVQITIAGNTDERGTEEYNLTLGDQRARSARDYLVRLGVKADRVRTISYGEDRPVDSSKTEEGHAANRRDDVIVH